MPVESPMRAPAANGCHAMYPPGCVRHDNDDNDDNHDNHPRPSVHLGAKEELENAAS